MGYRSNVAIAVSKIAYTKSMLKQDLPVMLKGNDTWVIANVNEDAFYWSIEDVKWYESYDDVAEVMAWLGTIETEKETGKSVDSTTGKPYHWEQEQYGFVRIGEEHNDLDELGDPYYFDISFHREIVTPFS